MLRKNHAVQTGVIGAVAMLWSCAASVPTATIDCNANPTAAGCSSTITDPPEGGGTETPVVSTPGTESIYNLELYAKIKSNIANVESSTRFRGLNAADNILANDQTNGSFHAWVPGRCVDEVIARSANLTFTWATPVEINSIKLWNANVKDDNHSSTAQVIKNSVVEFYEDEVTSTVLQTLDTGALNEDGSAKEYSVTLNKRVKKMVFKILDSQGECAGLSEIAIKGSRLNEDNPKDTDISPYAYVEAVSSTLGLTAETKSKFTYSSSVSASDMNFNKFNVKDDLAESRWVSNKAGTNAYVQLKYDYPTCIKSISVKDAEMESSSARVTSVSLRIDDFDAEEINLSSGAGTYTVPSDKQMAQTIRVQVTAVSGGLTETGFKFIKLMSCD